MFNIRIKGTIVFVKRFFILSRMFNSVLISRGGGDRSFECVAIATAMLSYCKVRDTIIGILVLWASCQCLFGSRSR